MYFNEYPSNYINYFELITFYDLIKHPKYEFRDKIDRDCLRFNQLNKKVHNSKKKA